jgi:hypothetical protein
MDADDREKFNALRIETSNLPGSVTPSGIRSTHSNASLDSYTSPVVTPSGSTLHLPSASLTPLPSPLVSAGTFSSTSQSSLDRFSLGTSPRRKGYGGLGIGVNFGDKRNTTEFVLSNGASESIERSVSIGRTTTDDGLRREEIHPVTKSRQSSIDEEIYVYPLGILM